VLAFPHDGMMLFEMSSCLCKTQRDELVLVQEAKLAHTIFPPRWDDVFQDELVLV
jgi:hypothetical protein